MEKVYVFFAEGFEEIEGLTVVDMLRRVQVETVMVSIGDTKTVTGAHGIVIQADGVFGDYTYEDGSMAVLPGGMPRYPGRNPGNQYVHGHRYGYGRRTAGGTV